MACATGCITLRSHRARAAAAGQLKVNALLIATEVWRTWMALLKPQPEPLSRSGTAS
ncbi:hypothetical protein D3C71_2077170 [compost metagenome]